jgi:hypothetical protein
LVVIGLVPKYVTILEEPLRCVTHVAVQHGQRIERFTFEDYMVRDAKARKLAIVNKAIDLKAMMIREEKIVMAVAKALTP